MQPAEYLYLGAVLVEEEEKSTTVTELIIH